MEFRPCIDIHDGKVKQIVGGSLSEKDGASLVKENFVATQDAPFFAQFYRKMGIRGGHVILLNGKDSPAFEETKRQAKAALGAYPGGLQIGGGITDENAGEYLQAGASHVIVTSFVFRDGRIDRERLEKLVRAVGREHIVLDMSCRKKNNSYIVVTDRWQKETKEEVTLSLLHDLSAYCDEFLIHAVDVEGKANGIEQPLVQLLGEFDERAVTYAGGVHSFEDLRLLKELGKGRVNVTIGSALNLFGGTMDLEEVLAYIDGGNRRAVPKKEPIA